MAGFRYPARMRDIARMFPEFTAADDILLGRWERLIELLERRDFELERFLASFNSAALVFFHKGPLTASDSALMPAVNTISVGTLMAAIAIAASTDTEVQILVDGVIKDTLTLPAGDTTASLTTSFSVPQGSIAIARIITPGSGGSDLTVVGA